MKMSYEKWRYSDLLSVKEQLEDLLQSGEEYFDVRAQLKAVDEEILKRTFVLSAEFDGRLVKEYGRWASKEECIEQAETMGLPVDVNFTLGKLLFRTIIQQID